MKPEDEAKLEALIKAAQILAGKVLAHCDDWAEGRAYAHAVLRWKDRYEATQESKRA